jgi:methionyl-tRNA synthetase
MPRIVEAEDLDGGAGYPIPKPSPVFVKLDPSVVEEELARLGE